ncbi:hypothetical protein D3Z48_18080 [Clostridiaceae bacterium]|nr:hypothetical protein [Clostridiaceae bacterium]
MDEYQPTAVEPRNPQMLAAAETVPAFSESPVVPCEPEVKPQNSLGKIIADLKNHDKDGGYTPATLLADIDGLVSRFHRDFAWYSEPQCTVVFPQKAPRM